MGASIESPPELPLPPPLDGGADAGACTTAGGVYAGCGGGVDDGTGVYAGACDAGATVVGVTAAIVGGSAETVLGCELDVLA